MDLCQGEGGRLGIEKKVKNLKIFDVEIFTLTLINVNNACYDIVLVSGSLLVCMLYHILLKLHGHIIVFKLFLFV
jgi:hypothetical protein